MRTLSEAWQDPEEGPLLRLALEGGEALARYVEWLQARGDARGELAGALWRLCEAPLDAGERAALAARVEALRSEEDPYWERLFARYAGPFNCGASEAADDVVRFAFRCPKRWELLSEGERPGERYCGACAQTVYLCETRAEAEGRARRGECVAVSAGLAGEVASEVTQLVLGRPDARRMWGERIFGRR